MKIASFNVNSIRARLDIVLPWMEEVSPDILCVQETKVVDENFPVDPFTRIRYNAVFCGEKKYNGVAIFSRHDIEDVKYGFDKSGQYGTRLISATIQGIQVVNSYVPQGFAPDSEKFQEKLFWFRRIHEFFRNNFSPHDPLIWLGDFNVAPEPKDIYDPEKLRGHVGFHPEEHKALQSVKEWGFVDVFRKHEPGEDQYSFWDYRIRGGVKRNLGWRIDHIWATKPLADRSVASWIDIEPRLRERPSDHTPVVAEFRQA